MRKGTKIVSFIMAMMLVVSVFAACGGKTEEKEFTKNGFTITLPENAKEMEDSSGFLVAYQIGNAIIVTAIQEGEDILATVGLDGNSSVMDYAEIVAEVNGYSADDVGTIEGTNIPMFEYSSTVDGVEYKYMGSFYSGTDSFWFINMGTTASNYDSVKEDFVRWAKSIEV